MKTKKLSPLELSILSKLLASPTYGYQLLAGAHEFVASTIYNCLANLEKLKLVTSKKIESKNSPVKHVYFVTPKQAKILSDYLDEQTKQLEKNILELNRLILNQRFHLNQVRCLQLKLQHQTYSQ